MASWKKTASILLIVMIILVTGCVKKNNTKSPATESAKNEVEVSVSTQKVPSKSTPSLAPTESIKSENPTQEPSSVVSTATATPSATQAVVTSNSTLVPSVNPTQTAAPTAKPTVKPTVAPKTTAPTVKPTAKPTATVKPTAKPTPTPTAKPTVAPYDDAKAQYWVDFAKDYALSIGLELVSDCTGCWDTPEVVYAKRTQSKIEKNLISRIDYYKEVGVKYVWVWYEKYDSEYAPTADAYQIYIGYGGLNEN
ncbi:MAG: hypothetical protein IKJ59_13025 [Clostridia bacterium]|nr:hypothetical protein [Clostridia bacterium]